jgi:hypothetical protein
MHEGYILAVIVIPVLVLTFDSLAYGGIDL